MAQSSPRKLPRGKADTYSMVALSDTSAVTPLLSNLSIATCNPSTEDDTSTEPVSQAPEAGNNHGDSVVTVSTRMSCTCCAVEFSHRTEQKSHFKSDWHRYNLKQQLRGETCITEDQFEAMTGEVSSISGSDDTSTSSGDEEASVKPTAIPARLKRLQVQDSMDTTDSEGEVNSSIMAATSKHPKVFLRNGSGQLISLYRCVLYHKKTSPNTPAELLSLAEQAKTYTRVAVVMLAGGHFSAGVFDGTEAVVHKTFHRYVVRAKSGRVQSARDSEGSAPKSGGASLRRYNEAALAQEIQELLTGWSQHLRSCHLIFLRTSAYSRNIFFGAKAPIFSKDDPRVRTIPFTTGRPTFNEAKRVHHMLMSVECFGDESLVTSFVPTSPPRHLHPETGQLVVRPDTRPARVPGPQGKAKGRTAKGDTAEETEKQAEAVDSGEEDEQSDREVELVAVMEEISTEDLQEFACSVGVPKASKKRRKKGGQKGAGKETTVTQQADQTLGDQTLGENQLSEEERQLKDRLYTCCKSGAVSQLSKVLEDLKDTAGHGSSSLGHLQHGLTTDSPQSHHSPQPECHPPLGVQSSAVPQNAHCHSAHDTEMVRTSTTDSVSEAEPDCVAQKCEPDSSEQRTDTANNDHQSTRPTESYISGTCPPSTLHSVSQFTDSEASSSPTHSQGVDCSQGAGDVDRQGVSPCDADPSVLAGQARFERVVLGRYGERGYSLLHVASSSGHGEVITTLLEAGCDPCVRDKNGKTPYAVASTKDVRNAFRRYRGNYPDHYDYESAQIPSGLTAEMEAERKQREAEKRKMQKKAKQERLKERKAEEAKAVQEQKEKDRFLALSDREKRALAAERRLLTQASGQGVDVVLNRCFQCGTDITGKVPFEYMEFRFCSPRCLKEHRMKGAR